MRENKITHAIVVFEGQFSCIAEKTLAHSAERVECFERKRLMFNVTKHEWVPKHTRLTVSQKKEVCAVWKLKETQFPVISVRDPVARWYGYRRGDLIKIVRPSETGGSYVLYRICK